MEQFYKAKTYLEEAGILDPQIAIVLGSGLHQFVQYIEDAITVPYSEIPGFPLATVEFHKGHLIFGKVGKRKVVVMQGRFHAYEGYSLQEIVFPIRVMKLLGVQQLFLSNAAGGINLNFKKGDLVLIDDHINLLSGSPLSGKNEETLEPRFPDMSEPYDEALKTALLTKAWELNISLKKGVYAAVHGPNLETKAEYRYLKIIGADLVGMSTVPEVIAANHLGLPCAAISVVTDECDPDHLKPVNIEEIIAVAGKADAVLSQLLLQMIKDN